MFFIGGQSGKWEKSPNSSVVAAFWSFLVVFSFVKFYNYKKGYFMKQKFLYDEAGRVYDSNGRFVGWLRLCIETKTGLVKITGKKPFRVVMKR